MWGSCAEARSRRYTRAKVPLGEMFGYATDLRSQTQGRASYTMQFDSYEPAPKSVTDETDVGRSILFLARHGICAVNAHTNLDCAPGGVNDVLAETLGLSDIRVLSPMGEDSQGRPWGLLRGGLVEEQSLADFLPKVKERLQAKGLRYVDSGKAVRRVAVGGGACADEMFTALDAGCDTFVTADVKYNEFWDAKFLGLNLIDAGHFATENPVVAVLAAKLRAAFPELPVECAENHHDCANFF